MVVRDRPSPINFAFSDIADMAPGPLFEQAAEQWNLARLCVDLAAAKAALMPHKRGELTDTEQARLRGLLLGYSGYC